MTVARQRAATWAPESRCCLVTNETGKPGTASERSDSSCPSRFSSFGGTDTCCPWCGEELETADRGDFEKRRHPKPHLSTPHPHIRLDGLAGREASDARLIPLRVSALGNQAKAIRFPASGAGALACSGPSANRGVSRRLEIAGRYSGVPQTPNDEKQEDATLRQLVTTQKPFGVSQSVTMADAQPKHRQK